MKLDTFLAHILSALTLLTACGSGRVKLIWNYNAETIRYVEGWQENNVETEVVWDVSDYRGE
jgi:hypothetical protein